MAFNKVQEAAWSYLTGKNRTAELKKLAQAGFFDPGKWTDDEQGNTQAVATIGVIWSDNEQLIRAGVCREGYDRFIKHLEAAATPTPLVGHGTTSTVPMPMLTGSVPSFSWSSPTSSKPATAT